MNPDGETGNPSSTSTIGEQKATDIFYLAIAKSGYPGLPEYL